MHLGAYGSVVFAFALVLASGCGGTSGTAASRAAPSGTASDPPASNERVLTHAESQRLVDWASSLRSCLQARGLEIGKRSVTRTLIELAVPRTTQHEVAEAAIRCGDGLGGPPAKSSVQIFPGHIVLYVPKQCLLDPKVASAGA
jgi:hypothetical protein